MKQWMEKLAKKNRLEWGLLASILFHVLFFSYFFLLPKPAEIVEFDLNKMPIEIANLPESVLNQAPTEQPRPAPNPKMKSKEMEMAETEDANNKELDPNARFLSDRNQKAEKEMRAQHTDDFRKQTGDGPKGDKKKGGDEPLTGDPDEVATNSDLEVPDGILAKPNKSKGVKRDWQKLSLKDLSVGSGDGGETGATDDRLKDVDTGERTILSTREFKYFSYYHRIKELLRQHWKPSVERRLYKIWERGKSVSEEEMVTRVLVLLSPDGKIAKISRVTSSGFGELDEAAIEAFHKAGPFPNPPTGIVDPDGFVRIRWDFILRAEAAPRIQFSNAGRPMP